LTAAAAVGSHFAGWTGCGSTSGTNNEVCVVALSDDMTVTASFDLNLTDLTATTVSASEIALAWTDQATDEVSFAIERSPDGVTDWQQIDTAPADAETYSDDALSCDIYYYRIRALYAGSLYSPYSNIDDAVTGPCNLFADVPTLNKEWMQPWIETFYLSGITGGCGQGPLRYCPESSATRGAMSVFILRAMSYPEIHVPPSSTGIFADVPTPDKEWMQPWIEEFYDLGITGGCGQSPLRFCPENPVTRGAMAVFILRALEGPSYTPPAASHFFSDVPTVGKEWMEPWIDEFYRRGITTGCSTVPVNYCPENPVTRGAMAVFILRAFDNLPQP
jgi:hypothetical protein